MKDEYKQLSRNADKLESRYNIAFSQLCDVIIEINLEDKEYSRKVCKSEDLFALPSSGDYEAALQYIIDYYIYEQDKVKIKQEFEIEVLMKEYIKGQNGKTCVYRFRQEKGGLIWLELRVVNLLEADAPCVMIAASKITERKMQQEKGRIAEQYDVALRNIYDELFELNVTRDEYKIIFNEDQKFVLPPKQGVLSDTIIDVSDYIVFCDDRERYLNFFNLERIAQEIQKGKEYVTDEFRNLCYNGEYHWISLTLIPVKDNELEEVIYLCFAMDIGDKKHAYEMEKQNTMYLRKQLDDERYRIIIEQTKTIVFEWLPNEDNCYISPRLAETFAGDYNGRDLFYVWKDNQVIHPGDSGKLDCFLGSLAEGNEQEVNVRLLNHEGKYIWCKIAVTCIRDSGGELKRVIGTINDIDEAVRSEEALKYRAEYDMLTGIFNVQAFYIEAQKLRETYKSQKYAVIRLDINRFKFINELYGMEEGDNLLRHIAKVIEKNVKKQDVYGRVTNDVFCLCVAYREDRDLTQLTRSLTGGIKEYEIGYRAAPSFGICIIDDNVTPVNVLCDRAGLALQTVKGSLIKNYAFYDDNLRGRQLAEREIEAEMDAALEKGEFQVYLQPKYRIDKNCVIGAESLVRWIHPVNGIIPPDSFIPLFEHNGFILKLDEFVWEETCKILRGWLDKGYEPVPVSVNVSRIHAYSKHFQKNICKIVDHYQIPHKLVELELTESTFADNQDELYEAMEKLQEKGFRFSMDDFGKGYSSLNMLKNVPINTIKLDREFLKETASTEKGKTIVRCTITMANQLNLHVIAEGVETEAQAAFLLECGCSRAQGFYYAKPMPADEFNQLVYNAKPFTILN